MAREGETQPNSVLDTLSAFVARKGRRAWRLTVVDKTTLSPHMMRLRFTGPDLGELEYRPGQDLVLEIPQAEGVARRHYTIRNHDAAMRMLDIDFVLHGDSPTGRWVETAKPGDELIGAGPRGHTYVREADWHLFIGDETCIPAIFAMLESLPWGARAFAFLETGAAEDRLATVAKAHAVLEWTVRDRTPAGPGRQQYDRVEQFLFPPGHGHACIIGETSNVRAIRQRLLERGLAKSQIAAEGYWRPGRVGGHDHV